MPPIQDTMEKATIPGISIAHISPDGTLSTRTFGAADTRSKAPVVPDTVFEAASLSKPVFAYLVLKAVERGLFSRDGESPESGLDRPLHEICAFGPLPLRTHPNYRLLTVRTILSHQAGLPNWFKPREDEDYLATVGTRFDYSGVAYCFLDEVLQHVSGQPLDVLSQAVFERLDMKHSRFVAPAEGTRAIGHDAAGRADTREHFPSALRPNPAASLFTTAEDYVKFLTACLQDEFIRKHLFEPQIDLRDKDPRAIKGDMALDALKSMRWGLGMGLQQAENGDL